MRSDHIRVKDAPAAAVPRPVVSSGGGGGIVYAAGGSGTQGSVQYPLQINTNEGVADDFLEVTTTEEKTFVFTQSCSWFTSGSSLVTMRIEIQPEAPVLISTLTRSAGAGTGQSASWTVVRTLPAGTWQFRGWMSQAASTLQGTIDLVIVEYPSTGFNSNRWIEL